MSAELVLLPRVAFRGREVTGPRLHGLLALLAADLGTGCSTARLVDGLWPDEQPEHPTKALQVLVSRARAQLGADVIASTPSGYRLAIDADHVDAAAVVVAAAAGTRHSRAGDHTSALADAESGLEHFVGTPAGDPALDDPLSVLRRERAGTRAALVRTRALSLARLGRRGEAAEVLAGLVRDRPRDEEALVELLRSEPAPAALARYDTYRRALRDELGTDPGPDLQAVHRQLLQGEGPAVRRGIAHDPNPLLGRAGDVAAVTALLHTSRVTSVVGPGGLGKTRLAHVVSREVEQRVVFFVGLAGVGEDAAVVAEVATALGIGDARPGRAAGPRDMVAGIVEAVGSGPVLLVLDNCEHVVDGAAELVRALVSMVRDLRVLTTSRTPLGLSSESVYLLPELTLPTTVELFGQRARAARPGVDLPAEVVEELCGHLDGLPLAVELAAARVRVMSAAEIARRLDDRFALLRGGPRDAPQRHRTLHAVVDWSWTLLEPDARTAMRLLSVFPGGFTADAAQHVLGGIDALGVLEHLVDQSLVTVVDGPSGVRFRMLETVREFSSAHRESAGETRRAVDGLVAWARAFGVEHHESPFTADPVPVLNRIRAELDNLVFALRDGIDREDGATVAATSAVLGSLWTMELNNGRVLALARDSSWVLSHFRPDPAFVDVTRAAAAVFAGHFFLLEGPRAVRAMVTLRRLPRVAPTTLTRAIATVLVEASRVRGSGHSVVEADAVVEALCASEEPLVAGMANAIACYMWTSAGELDRALASARQMSAVFDERTTPWLQLVAHTVTSDVCVQVEQGDEALRHAEAGLRVLQRFGAWPGAGQFQWTVVMAQMCRGAVDEAAELLDRTMPHLTEDDPGTVPFVAGVQAEILLARGQVDAGLLRWRHAVDLTVEDDGGTPGAAASGIEIMSVAVVAHARHGRSDLVATTAGRLRDRIHAILADPAIPVGWYLLGFPIVGAALFAVGAVEGGAAGARTIALAQRLHFIRNFQPTMTDARARTAAEQADPAAYAVAVAEYAALGQDDLRAAALAALEAGQGPPAARVQTFGNGSGPS